MTRRRPQDTSWIGWAFFDEAQAEETRRYLADLDANHATVDALGLGGILEAVSDALFPATSTLHRRIRYQLFLPAILFSLNCRRKPFVGATELRRAEFQLQRALTLAGQQEVIGRFKGMKLRYWPSQLYWNSLNTLEMFGPQPISLDKALAQLEAHARPALVNEDRESENNDHATLELDSEIRPIALKMFESLAETNWPDRIDFELTHDEAIYLKGKFDKFEDSLSNWLLRQPISHIQRLTLENIGSTKLPKRDYLVTHARLFSRLAMGATYAYRWALCGHKHDQIHKKAAKWKQGQDVNASRFTQWLGASRKCVANWQFDDFASSLKDYNWKQDSTDVKGFCEEFLRRINSITDPHAVLASCLPLMRERELRMKKIGNSRFENPAIAVPRNVYDSREEDPEMLLFAYRWGRGIANAIDIRRGLRRA